MKKSKYDSAEDVEFNRLAVQAETVKPFDTHIMLKSIDALIASGKKKGSTIYILELGGASMVGAMTSKYNKEVLDYIKKAGFKLKIINAEYNAKTIEQAEYYFGKTQFCGQQLVFNHQIDLNDNPSESLKQLNQQYTNGEGFDLICLNYVLQHLQNPEEVLAAANENLSNIGLSSHVVPDDGFKFQSFYLNGHPDKTANDAAEKIVKIFIDTLNPAVDRFAGRKIFEAQKDIFKYDYSKVAIDRAMSQAQLKDAIARDFWYSDALRGAALDGHPTADAARKRADELMGIINEELKKGATYTLGEYRLISGKNKEFKLEDGVKLENGKELQETSIVKFYTKESLQK